MKFWELREPPGSDYRHVQVSGKLDHPYRLPQAQCEACGETVSSFDAVLPYECPRTMRRYAQLTDHDAEISMKEFRKLERQVATELRKTGIKNPSLNPGACLQPGFLDVPSVPKHDFLWSDVWSGLSSMVVSERVRELLIEQTANAVALCPVILRKVGKRSAQSAPRIPKSGEPDMKQYSEARPRDVGPYYQLIVIAQSGYPPGTEPGPVCEVCGEEVEQDWKAEDSRARQRWRTQQEAWKTLTGKVLESVWSGTPIFRLAGQGTVLVTDGLKARLEQMSNVSFREFPIRSK